MSKQAETRYNLMQNDFNNILSIFMPLLLNLFLHLALMTVYLHHNDR